MTRPLLLGSLVLVLGGTLAIAGCPRQDAPPLVSPAIELPVQPPAVELAPAPELEPSPNAPAGGATADRREADDALPLPIAWATAFGHTRPFAQAIAHARATRTSFDRQAARVTADVDGGAPSSPAFAAALAMVDDASRRFAAAYHAPDATADDRIDALREATAMILGWAQQLDVAGLSRAPAHYRADPQIALTFEDVAHGPAKRWRQEGLALLQLCNDTARASRVDTPSARECSAMRRTYARVFMGSGSRPSVSRDAGACACDPGDPLCSATMNGWCRPK